MEKEFPLTEEELDGAIDVWIAGLGEDKYVWDTTGDITGDKLLEYGDVGVSVLFLVTTTTEDEVGEET